MGLSKVVTFTINASGPPVHGAITFPVSLQYSRVRMFECVGVTADDRLPLSAISRLLSKMETLRRPLHVVYRNGGAIANL